jgi:hypothetical protein
MQKMSWLAEKLSVRKSDSAQVWFEVLTVVSTKIAVLWVVAPCRLANFPTFQTSETLANSYQSTRRYNPKGSHLRTVHRGGSWMSGNFGIRDLESYQLEQRNGGEEVTLKRILGTQFFKCVGLNWLKFDSVAHFRITDVEIPDFNIRQSHIRGPIIPLLNTF